MFFHGYWWIFPLVIIIVCFLFMRGGGRCGCGSHDDQRPDSPKEMLNRRYASGEIDKEEYEEKKKNIKNNS